MLELIAFLMMLAFGALCAGVLFLLLGPWLSLLITTLLVVMGVQTFKTGFKKEYERLTRHLRSS
jgi:membrane protein implicated in regulation of membrane protease activity